MYGAGRLGWVCPSRHTVIQPTTCDLFSETSPRATLRKWYGERQDPPNRTAVLLDGDECDAHVITGPNFGFHRSQAGAAAAGSIDLHSLCGSL
jgi:hypothetical protein